MPPCAREPAVAGGRRRLERRAVALEAQLARRARGGEVQRLERQPRPSSTLRPPSRRRRPRRPARPHVDRRGAGERRVRARTGSGTAGRRARRAWPSRPGAAGEARRRRAPRACRAARRAGAGSSSKPPALERPRGGRGEAERPLDRPRLEARDPAPRRAVAASEGAVASSSPVERHEQRRRVGRLAQLRGRAAARGRRPSPRRQTRRVAPPRARAGAAGPARAQLPPRTLASSRSTRTSRPAKRAASLSSLQRAPSKRPRHVGEPRLARELRGLAGAADLQPQRARRRRGAAAGQRRVERVEVDVALDGEVEGASAARARPGRRRESAVRRAASAQPRERRARRRSPVEAEGRRRSTRGWRRLPRDARAPPAE